MLNKAPIFINGFSYGGTNLITNILASHPDICILTGETHEVFYGKPNKTIDQLVRRTFYLPVFIFTQQHVFGRKCLDKRRKIPKLLLNYIDFIFFIDKLIRWKKDSCYRNAEHEKRDIRNCRFLAKNVNGVIFASDVLSDIYPDATFIALVRNGFALCEGYLRRGWNAKDFGMMYERVCQKMIHDSKNLQNYHVVHFEEMVSDPLNFMKKIYSFSNLDISKVSKIRLQAKKSMDKNGIRKYIFGGEKDREIYWFPINEIENYIRTDVNENQIIQLSEKDRTIFLQYAKKSMEYFGYL
ncbi:MAG: sulfotransferase family protein [Thermodesulfovibrionales bacterium]